MGKSAHGLWMAPNLHGKDASMNSFDSMISRRKHILPFALLFALLDLGCCPTSKHPPSVSSYKVTPLGIEIAAISRTGLYGRRLKAEIEFTNKSASNVVVDTHGLRLTVYELETKDCFASQRLEPADAHECNLVAGRYFVVPGFGTRTMSFMTRYMGDSNAIERFAYAWPDTRHQDWESGKWKQCAATAHYDIPYGSLSGEFETDASLFDYASIGSSEYVVDADMDPCKSPLQVDLISAQMTDDGSGQILYTVRVETDSEMPVAIDAKGFVIHIEWFDRNFLLKQYAYGLDPKVVALQSDAADIKQRVITLPPRNVRLITFQTKYIGSFDKGYEKSGYADPVKKHWEIRMADRYKVQARYYVPRERQHPAMYIDEMPDPNRLEILYSEKMETDLRQKSFVGDGWLHAADVPPKP